MSFTRQNIVDPRNIKLLHQSSHILLSALPLPHQHVLNHLNLITGTKRVKTMQEQHQSQQHRGCYC